MLVDEKANEQSYDYWRRSVLKRVKDPEKQRLLAPEVKPHPFGTKRCSLERRFYEVVDQDHIDIISVKENPIEGVTATGLRTPKDHVEVDVSQQLECEIQMNTTLTHCRLSSSRLDSIASPALWAN